MNYTHACPRCGYESTGEDRDTVANEMIKHAKDEHKHDLTREHALAHLDPPDQSDQ